MFSINRVIERVKDINTLRYFWRVWE